MSEQIAKIGFFGGTFDPIHFGHLKMASDLANMDKLREVWFCPARISPFKIHDTPEPIEHRLKMTELAIADDPRFTLLDIESKKDEVSYTVDTIRALVEREKSRGNPRKIYLLLSDESLKGFSDWKEPEELVALAPLLIARRNSSERTPPDFEGSSSIRRAIKRGWRLTEPFSISSTEIRRRLRNGEDCSHLVPKKVLDYIYQNNLYCKV